MKKDDLLGDLVAEARDILDDLEIDLLGLRLEWREGQDHRERLHGAFRKFHTLKGTSGFFHLPTVVAVTHEAESLLDLLRAREIDLDETILEDLFAVRDFLRELFDAVEARGHDRDFEAAAAPLLERLRERAGGRPAPRIPTESFGLFESAPEREEEQSAAEARAEPAAGFGSRAGPAKERQASVRVAVEKIDALMDLVGELVIAESMIDRYAAADGRCDLEGLRKSAAFLKRQVRELQHATLRMRTVPVAGMFRRVERQVQDLARRSGKAVRVTFAGEETELDRGVAERLADPLLHIVRNAIDHGLESPAERARAQKNETGRLDIAAVHSGNEVHLRIEDDGRGLDRAAILARARERGLIEASVQPDDEQICEFIFEPGFSTARSVSDISGRGVGMDVVRRNVEELKGRIVVRSDPGAGTGILLQIPLTLAIIEGMVLDVGRRRYVAPTVMVRRSLARSAARVERIGADLELVAFEGRHVPLLDLSRLFSCGILAKGEAGDAESHARLATEQDGARSGGRGLVVFFEAGARTVAIGADEILENRQIVVKTLPEYLRGVPGLAGCTILGDGTISMILDVHALTRIGTANQAAFAISRGAAG